MFINQVSSKGRQLLIFTFVVVMLISVALGCDTQNQPADTNHAQTYTISVTPTVNPADATWDAAKQTLTYEQFHFREIKETAIAQTATAIALTPTYTPSPISPSPTAGSPEPTQTPQMGIIDCGADTAGYPYLEYNCWRGIVNGRGTIISAGRERLGAGGDPTQGFLFIYYPLPSAEYKTPSKSGTVRIVSVNGTKVTLMATDPDDPSTIFTFNLSTHQFENQSGTPLPTTPVAP